MELYGYYRSSAAYRVRIALELKGVNCIHKSVQLVQAEQKGEAYLSINPQGLVPTLVDGDLALGQSMAIIEYLEETYPDPPLLPTAATARAQVRALSQLIAIDIHPLNNLRVLKYLTGKLSISETQKSDWYRYWINEGFQALETQLQALGQQGPFCWGQQVTLIDLCLVPQVYNARRFDCSLENFPLIRAVDRACSQLPAFQQALPEVQIDAGG